MKQKEILEKRLAATFYMIEKSIPREVVVTRGVSLKEIYLKLKIAIEESKEEQIKPEQTEEWKQKRAWLIDALMADTGCTRREAITAAKIRLSPLTRAITIEKAVSVLSIAQDQVRDVINDLVSRGMLDKDLLAYKADYSNMELKRCKGRKFMLSLLNVPDDKINACEDVIIQIKDTLMIKGVTVEECFKSKEFNPTGLEIYAIKRILKYFVDTNKLKRLPLEERIKKPKYLYTMITK